MPVFNHFIDNLNNAINLKPLPGIKAHEQLMPKNRNTLPKSNIGTARQSAVLLLIYPAPAGEPTIVFIKRNFYKGHHSNQIGLPGGKKEPCDADMIETALRETHEEIGITIQRAQIIGKLTELHIPVSNFLVHPYIAYTNTTPIFKPNKQEVNKLVEICIKNLIQLPILTYQANFNNTKNNIPYYPLKKEKLWGATAMIIREFLSILE